LFGAEIQDLSDAELAQVFADVPSREMPRSRLAGEGLPLVDALCETGLAQTRSAARRTITQGGAYVNNRRVEAVEARLGAQHLAGESIVVLRTGKKKYALLRFRDG
jgi:tyrosyl-tRNA synthetase